jgi:alginate O-acetyltransferase complex protein AlgI
MVYTSLEFFVLFLITLALFTGLRSYRARFVTLTLASLIFYAWAGIFDFCVFLFVVAVSYLAAFLSQRDSARRRFWISSGVVVLIAHLILWKYVPWISHGLGRELYLPLPIGISFFTFQGIAFLVDLSRGDAPMMNLGEYLLFKSFFSQLIAGPIVRAKELVPQLRSLKKPTSEDLVQGVSLFTMGLFKKLVIADHLSLFVFNVFNSPSKYDRSTLIWGILSFTAQDWADFSGYTDMGRGTARMLGIKLPENFLTPALARTPIEVWKRWHITLAHWMRDYVFFPLNRVIPVKNRLTRSVIAILITFLLTGLWHGASLTYALWGLYMGFLFLLELLISRTALATWWERSIPYRARTLVLVPLTFLSGILGLTLYRSLSLEQFGVYFRTLWEGGDKISLMSSASPVYWACFFTAVFQFVFYYSFVKESWPVLDLAKAAWSRIESPGHARILGCVAGILVGIALIASIAYRQYESFASFIYFQF